MTLQRFLLGLALIAVLGVAVWAATYAVYGAQWSSFYGWAVAVLACVPGLAWVLGRRLRTNGHSRFWSLLVVVPMALAAIGQIGYWLAFFSDANSAVLLSMVRGGINANGAVLYATLGFVFGVLGLLVFIKTVTRKKTEAEFQAGL
ncbi:MAG: hypothetical protein AAFQ17_01565 [Pseudomonadota bacterium]